MLFGYDENDIGDSVDDWAKLLHPDKRDWMLKFLDDFLAGNSPTTTVEYRLRHKDGSYRWIVAHGLVVRDEQGKAYRFVGSHGDITDRKGAEEGSLQAQELLKESESRYRELIENQGEVVGIADSQERFTFVNPAAERIFGVPQGSLAGRLLSEFMTQDQYAQVLEQTKKRRAGRKEHLRVGNLRPSGETRCLLVTAVPRIDRAGQFVGTFGLFCDITERKQAEEALRQSEERFRVAFEDAPLGIVMTVGEGILVRANRTFCRMSGYTEEELIGKSVLAITHPEDREDTQRLGAQVLAGANPGITMEKRYLKKHGGFFWGQIAVTAIHDRGGNVIFVLGIIEDITERKRAEEALRRNTATSGTCSDPATTNGNSSPTKSTTGWPSSWPGRSCSSRPSIT